jgi:hypothetical protein
MDAKHSVRRLAKDQAKDQFAPLVESIATDSGVIEITDDDS